MLKQKNQPFYFIVPKFVIASVKSFRLVREMEESTAVLFHRKKTKKKYQKSKENMLLKLIFVIWFIAHEQIGAQSTQGILARDHVSTQGTLASEHVSTQDALAREHVSTQGT